MKNRIGIVVALVFVLSLVVYGCTASGSVGTNHQKTQTTSSPR